MIFKLITMLFALTSNISAGLKAAPDVIWDGEALPNATDKDSDVFQGGEVQGALEIVIKAGTDISIAVGESLTFSLLGAATRAGVYAVENTIFTVTADGDPSTWSAGDEIARMIIPTDASLFNKVRATCSDDESSETVDVALEMVAR